ncbi:MAG: hypothetical protein ACQXXJ_09225, partial [Candidatus Bathyarchaeia archaeon]|jgi:hypothetical protein
MFTGDLEFYSFQFERDQIRAVNNIFAGTYVIDNGKVKVAESCPSGINNPEIWGYIKGKYEKLLSFSDYQHQLFFRLADSAENITIAPFSSQNSTATIQQSDSGVEIKVTYENPQFTVTRNVIVRENEATVDVTYQITPKNSTIIQQLKFNLWGLFKTSPENCKASNNGDVALSTEGSTAESAAVVIKVQQTNGKLERAIVFFEDPPVCEPTASYMFESVQDEFYVQFKIVINESSSSSGSQPVNVYESYDLLKELNINYIMVNRNRFDEVQRFLSDKEHFAVEFQNEEVLIFKVST